MESEKYQNTHHHIDSDEEVYFIETEKKVIRDRPIKSVMKAITWRIIASATTFALAVFFFDEDPDAIEKASYVAIFESLIKIILYFLHERAWALLRWGRMLVVLRRNSPFSKNFFNKLFFVKNK
ncbi:MAG: DUF2061 domain-containing protein [Bacteroidales bacterium]